MRHRVDVNALALLALANLVAGCGGNAPSSGIPAIEPDSRLANAPPRPASAFAVLHRFTGRDGGSPIGPFVADPSGNLYGVALYGGSQNAGVVFEIMRPSQKSAKWTESVLHSFAPGSQGAYPQPGLVRDGAGNLYGVTFAGGKCASGCGVAFEVSPPRRPAGGWHYTVLHAFDGPGIGGGGGPVGNLVTDAAGALYGATYHGGSSVCTNDQGPCGVIFQLAPPTSKSQAWRETVLHSFTGIPDGDAPRTGVTLDLDGNVFGTTSSGGTGKCTDGEGTTIGCGLIFELSPAGSTWNETILYDFKPKLGSGAPDAALLMRSDGSLLGPAAYDVLEFAPIRSGSRWSAHILYQFKEGIAGTLPSSALLDGGNGNNFGTSSASGLYGYGTIYRLQRGVRPAAWSVTTLHTLSGGLDSVQPRGGVVYGWQGALYGAASSFAKPNAGYVFRIAP